VKDAGICRLAMPVSLGGLALDPMTTIEVIEELSKADGSAGWTSLIGNSTAFLAWNTPDAARRLLDGNPNASMTSMFAPIGTAVPDGDDVIVSGRWPFNSGCPHADLIEVGVIVTDGPLAGWRFATLRPEQVQIVDGSWDSAGLRGTGSNDIVITDARIPLDQLSMPMTDPNHHADDGPLHRLPFFQLLIGIMSGFPLGVARRALDELEALAPTKRRGGASPFTVAEDPHVQYDVGLAEAKVQAARAFLLDAADEVWTAATEGEIAEPALQRYSLAGRYVMTAAIDAVDIAFHHAGAGAVHHDHPLQRCFRDIHVASQHVFFSDEQYRGYGELAMKPPVADR
jgi:alkylation response protein AidB-like acyl-CoA dehydrogenase